MALGPRGLFETLEDGTIIYYGKMGWNKPGYIVDEATMRATRGWLRRRQVRRF